MFGPTPEPKISPAAQTSSRARRSPPRNSSPEDDEVQHSRQGRCVPDQMMIGLVDWIRTEQRHHHRLHQQLERDAEHQPDSKVSDPASRPDEADFLPWRM